jgi:hypothetical protein
MMDRKGKMGSYFAMMKQTRLEIACSWLEKGTKRRHAMLLNKSRAYREG